MKVNGRHRRTIWLESDGSVGIIDQNRLPGELRDLRLETAEDAARAIADMNVRGAGLIGATAAFGMYLAVRTEAAGAASDDLNDTPKHDTPKNRLVGAADLLRGTRPTARNLAWAVERMLAAITTVESVDGKLRIAKETACAIADGDADACRAIGDHGITLIQEIGEKRKGEPVRILTHCNAGWLAFVDYGSATAPIYAAHDAGMEVHVWVDETRPRNQGARLTAWELGQHGVSHTLIADNTGGHLMQHGMVDLVLVGADRVTRAGDAANKIGTYLKALAAKDNGVPFYVALPSSTFDWTIDDGVREIPIEERDQREVTYVSGYDNTGSNVEVRICPEETIAANYAFDVTPSRLIDGLITERGICRAESRAIETLFPREGGI